MRFANPVRAPRTPQQPDPIPRGVCQWNGNSNRTDLTDDHKEKEKRSKKERETDYDDDVASPWELPMIINKVGPVYSPMWVQFSRRLPPEFVVLLPTIAIPTSVASRHM
ncbi:MAG: hypothetical protein ACT4QE_09480, partial [Anaerolineales bacterium]